MNKEHKQQAEIVNKRSWILMIVVLSIPLLNVLVALVMIFNEKTNPNQVNFLKAFAAIIGIYFFILTVILPIISPFVEPEADHPQETPKAANAAFEDKKSTPLT